MTTKSYHIPVLLKESLEYLDIRPGKTYVDATLGGGGHSAGILEKIGKKGRLIAFDRDGEAIEEAKKRLGEERVTYVRDNFANLSSALKGLGIKKIDGILLDLGVSSHQIDTGSRGFSFQASGPLDMRMDESRSMSAREIINSFSERDLSSLIRDFGEERLSGKIAGTIVSERKRGEISTTEALVGVIEKAVGFLPPKQKRDCVARTFQALRIAVNDELGSLKKALTDSLDLLNHEGRIVVISYHSLEDRIVKEFFRGQANPCTCPPEFPKCVCGSMPRLKVLTKKPVRPGDDEVRSNPRSKSAKLRAAERI